MSRHENDGWQAVSRSGEWDITSLTIDRGVPVPLYYQLAHQLQSAIESGALPPGRHLPNEVAIAKALGLARPTVRQAMGYLMHKGLVSRKRALGTVVLNPKVDRDVQLSSLYDDLAREGRRPNTTVLRCELVPMSAVVADALRLEEGGRVLFLERIRSADDEPIALMHNYLPEGLVDVTSDQLAEHGLYGLLRTAGVKLVEARQRMGAKKAGAREARLLAEPRGAALVTMERLTFDADHRPVEYAEHVYRASRYSFSSTITITS
jgi:DNA-binding GntR family transcriptional regulator